MTKRDLLTLAMCCAIACGGSKSGNSAKTNISNFVTEQTSACNVNQTQLLAPDASSRASTMLDTSTLGSMECVSWRHQNSFLHLEISNSIPVTVVGGNRARPPLSESGQFLEPAATLLLDGA